jgi:GAF domain-containing protein
VGGNAGDRFPLTRQTTAGQALLDGRTAHFADIAALDSVQFAMAHRLSLQQGFRASLAAPLLREGVAVGAVVLRRTSPGAFTPRQIELLEGFAAQAVIAIENVRLFTELRERTDDLTQSLEYQTATSEVLEVISRSTADIQPVLDSMAAAAVRLCGAASGTIAIRQGDVYRHVASVGLGPVFDRALRERPLVPGRGTISERVLLERRIVHVADLETDPDYALHDAVRSDRLHTALGVPLMR